MEDFSKDWISQLNQHAYNHSLNYKMSPKVKQIFIFKLKIDAWNLFFFLMKLCTYVVEPTRCWCESKYFKIIIIFTTATTANQCFLIFNDLYYFCLIAYNSDSQSKWWEEMWASRRWHWHIWTINMHHTRTNASCLHFTLLQFIQWWHPTGSDLFAWTDS